MDSSSLIDCWIKLYRPETFVGVWAVLAELADQRRLISPREVQTELMRGPDNQEGLKDWISDRDGIFVDPDRAQEATVAEIAQKFPSLVTTGRLRRGADPWVVALARARKATVVTEEGLKGVRIPTLCTALRVTQIDVSEMICTQGRQFVLDS